MFDDQISSYKTFLIKNLPIALIKISTYLQKQGFSCKRKRSIKIYSRQSKKWQRDKNFIARGSDIREIAMNDDYNKHYKDIPTIF